MPHTWEVVSSSPHFLLEIANDWFGGDQWDSVQPFTIPVNHIIYLFQKRKKRVCLNRIICTKQRHQNRRKKNKLETLNATTKRTTRNRKCKTTENVNFDHMAEDRWISRPHQSIQYICSVVHLLYFGWIFHNDMILIAYIFLGTNPVGICPNRMHKKKNSQQPYSSEMNSRAPVFFLVCSKTNPVRSSVIPLVAECADRLNRILLK